jgi:hypothetical protein
MSAAHQRFSRLKECGRGAAWVKIDVGDFSRHFHFGLIHAGVTTGCSWLYVLLHSYRRSLFGALAPLPEPGSPGVRSQGGTARRCVVSLPV